MLPKASDDDICERLDLKVMHAYDAEPENVRSTRQQFLQNWTKDEQISKLALSNLEGLNSVDHQFDAQAMRNIIDYWFEPILFKTTTRGQARDYFLAITDRYDFEVGMEIPQAGDAPLFIETMHHSCIFSIGYALAHNFLIPNLGYEKAIMFHMQEALDIRLVILQDLARNLLNIEFELIHMDGDWLNKVIQEANEKTFIIYMGDLPPSLFEKQHRPGKTSRHVHLFGEQGLSVEAEGISMGHLLSRRLRANHMLLDVPEKNKVCLRPEEKGEALKCSLAEWVFWPALGQLYSNYKVVSSD